MKRFFRHARHSANFLLIAFAATLFAGCNAAQNATTAQNATAANAASTRDIATNSTHSEHQHAPGEGLGMHADSTTMVFSSQPSPVKAGAKARWTLQINDKESGKPVPDFVKMHDKLLHLIVASKDLLFYTHIHPRYAGNGTFTIDYALPRAGKYHVYADYVTAKMQHEVSRHELQVGGENALPEKPSLVADKMKGMWIAKKFRAHDEGQPPPANARSYEVALMPMPSQLRAGQEAMLHFQVRDEKGKPLSDLEPYMGAMGHAVILSQDGKVYLHTHPMSGDMAEMKGGATDHSAHGDAVKTGGDAHAGHDMTAMMKSLPASTRGGPDIMFHTTFPTAGTYRVWGQFMHKGKVITTNFTLRVLVAAPGA